MGKIKLIYGVMGTSKTTLLMTEIYNREQLGNQILIVKPFVDKKGGEYIESRMVGQFYRPVDVMVLPDELFAQACKRKDINPLGYSYIAVDEAQFLSRRHIYEMWVISKEHDIDFIFSSLKTNFLGEFFEGSSELLSKADEKTELFRSCQIPGCRDVAQYNARKVNDVWVSDGEEVVIDGTQNVQYLSICGQHFYEFVMKEKGNQFVLR